MNDPRRSSPGDSPENPRVDPPIVGAETLVWGAPGAHEVLDLPRTVDPRKEAIIDFCRMYGRRPLYQPDRDRFEQRLARLMRDYLDPTSCFYDAELVLCLNADWPEVHG